MDSQSVFFFAAGEIHSVRQQMLLPTLGVTSTSNYSDLHQGRISLPTLPKLAMEFVSIFVGKLAYIYNIYI